jgi:hydroxymethylpyrimidine/phosphomethylpyrimidine kinase
MTSAPLPRALTTAGSDSGGGAGAQADLKTFETWGVYGTSVLTALTAQNTLGVHGVHEVPAQFVAAQLDAVADDIGVDAAKTGMLATAGVIEAVVVGLGRHGIGRLVVDPVAVSKHGDPLLADDAVAALRDELLPLAELATPNTGEVELLTGFRVGGRADLAAAAQRVKALGPSWVLIKGGHLADNSDAVDVLTDGETELELPAERLEATDTHGTGCTLAAAITAQRAAGVELVDAVRAAKSFVTGAIRHGLRLGSGVGPVDPGWTRRSA